MCSRMLIRFRAVAALTVEATTATQRTLGKSDLSSSGTSSGMRIEWNLMETNGDEVKRRSVARILVGFSL